MWFINECDFVSSIWNFIISEGFGINFSKDKFFWNTRKKKFQISDDYKKIIPTINNT